MLVIDFSCFDFFVFEAVRYPSFTSVLFYLNFINSSWYPKKLIILHSGDIRTNSPIFLQSMSLFFLTLSLQQGFKEEDTKSTLHSILFKQGKTKEHNSERGDWFKQSHLEMCRKSKASNRFTGMVVNNSALCFTFTRSFMFILFMAWFPQAKSIISL